MKTIKKILIAEDELLIAKVLRLQLEKLGFEVANVAEANDAFNMATQFQPDLIIMDVYLKNKTTGIEAAKKFLNLEFESIMEGKFLFFYHLIIISNYYYFRY